MQRQSIWIGFDPREAEAFAVARSSVARHLNLPVPTRGVVLGSMRARGIYNRPTSSREGRLWDDISEAPMSTEFAVSRFLVPHLAESGLALFMDCDVLARENVQRLFDSVDRSKAVSVVQHNFDPPEGMKMDGQVQLRYARKNWSSVMVFNVDHPANRGLTVDLVNTVPGRDLHRFCWLEDDQIGALDPKWNWLVGHSDPGIDPAIVHFTDGVPSMSGYEDCAFADEWRSELHRWAA